MSIGRNDPCPCGSGKKYEKCCLARDEEAQREAIAAPPVPTTEREASVREESSKSLPDLDIDAWNQRYDEFEAADYEERIALFKRTLDESELMNDEMAFEMLYRLFEETAKRGERERFDKLAESLRKQLPKVYEEGAIDILEWRITNALVMNRPELVDSLAREFAMIAHQQIGTWSQIEARLAYHGYLTTLVEAMRLAWPKVSTSKEVTAWGKEEFSNRARQFEVLNYVMQTDAPEGNDPVLLERIRFFIGDGFDPDRLASAVGYVSGRKDRQWTMGDFDPQHIPGGDQKGEDRHDVEQNLTYLIAQFVGYAHGQDKHDVERNLTYLMAQFDGYAHDVEGVPYSKVEIARSEIFGLVSGQIEQYASRKGAAKKNSQSAHPLCPNPDRLTNHLAELESIFDYQPHKAVALMEMIPVWMRFLQSRGLLDAELRKRTLNDLRQVAGDLHQRLDHILSDPALGKALERWPEEIEKEPQ